MIKKERRNIIILVVLFVALIVAEHFAPKPIDWNYTFGESDKIPYGCMVLRKSMLPVLFGENLVVDNHTTFYESFNNLPEGEKNLIIITSSFKPEKLDLEKLLGFVNNGNRVFIASYMFSEQLLDTLKFRTKILPIDTGLLKHGEEALRLVNPYLARENGYIFNKKLPVHYFTKFDTARSVILGQDASNHINFIKTRFGQGFFYIHCQPSVFTNYHLLYSDFSYTSASLSYLPITYTIWDEYYKPFKKNISTPVRYILSQKPLRAAYFLTIFTILLYMLFEGKRRQRAMPVIKPLPNTSLDFIETVGKLYLRGNDHRDLALKKIVFLNESIQSRYLINMNVNNDEHFNKLSRKSGVDIAVIQKIYSTAEYVKQQKKISAGELTKLHQMIQEFNNNCY